MAGNKPKCLYGLLPIKCHSDDAFGNKSSETGKPLKLETQILVGES